MLEEPAAELDPAGQILDRVSRSFHNLTFKC